MRGWQLGIPEIKNGGTVTLYLPSRYAYGPYPQPDLGLPANAVLVFQITLYNVTN
jgi:FKBP-type peptidyl-prolyl cis-trans isomerase FkpA